MRAKLFGLIVPLLTFAAVSIGPGVAQAAWLSEEGSLAKLWQSSGPIQFSPPLEEFGAYPECVEDIHGDAFLNSKESGYPSRSILNSVSIKGVGLGKGNCGKIWARYTWRVEPLTDEDNLWGLLFDSEGGTRLVGFTGIQDVRYRIIVYDYEGKSPLASCIYQTDEFSGAVGPFQENDLQGLELEAKLEATDPEECEFWNSSITVHKTLYVSSETNKNIYLTE